MVTISISKYLFRELYTWKIYIWLSLKLAQLLVYLISHPGWVSYRRCKVYYSSYVDCLYWDHFDILFMIFRHQFSTFTFHYWSSYWLIRLLDFSSHLIIHYCSLGTIMKQLQMIWFEFCCASFSHLLLINIAWCFSAFIVIC